MNLEAIFEANALTIAAIGRGAPWHWANLSRAIAQIGPAYDGLQDAESPWAPWKTLNFAAMMRAQPNRLCAVVATARNEGPYLLEWIAHQRAVGFEHVFIYTNDNTDGSEIVLRLLHEAGVITLIESSNGPGCAPQKKSYEHSVHLLRPLREFEWVAYFDIDEFVIPDQRFNYDIRNFLNDGMARLRGHPPGAVLLNWDWYGSDGHVRRSDGLVQRRFTVRRDYGTVKCIAHLPSITRMDYVHTPDFTVRLVNSSFNPTTITPWQVLPIDYSGARLNHYFHKSFEEFANKKFRGIGDQPVDGVGRDFNSFFQWQPNAVSGSKREPPAALMDRVERNMADLAHIPGVSEAVQDTVGAHKRIADAMFGGDIGAAYAVAERAATEDWMRSQA